MLSQSQWERYRQKYRPEWANDPLFQGLINIETDCILDFAAYLDSMTGFAILN